MPTDPSDSTFWAMLEAIGTITASVIALFSVIYFEIIRPRRNRPTLQINYENRSPYSAMTDLILGGKPPRIQTSLAKQIRVGVLNTSNTPARGVRVKLSNVSGEDRRTTDGFIPYDLPWVDTKEARREILGKHEEGLVELIIGVRSDPDFWWFQPYDPSHSIGFGNLAGLPETPEPPFKAFVEVTAYAENLTEPVVQTFEVAYDRPSKLGSMKLHHSDLEIEQ